MNLPLLQSEQDALETLNLPDEELFNLADATRRKRSGRTVDICSIVNAKSGGCPEDCSFCAQARSSRSGVSVYPLISSEEIGEACTSALANGARRFCIVTSGRRVTDADLVRIEDGIRLVASLGLLPCATLGILKREDLERLKSAGLHRYHHNLETSEAFFSEICTTHTYRQKLETIHAARATGLSVCSGGIFGIGETWTDRIQMAFALRALDVDSVPINFLVPIEGTPLGSRQPLPAREALRIIALYRLVMPDREIRVCGGRDTALGARTDEIFRAGADGFLIGNYLTRAGRDPELDTQMLEELSLEAL